MEGDVDSMGMEESRLDSVSKVADSVVAVAADVGGGVGGSTGT